MIEVKNLTKEFKKPVRKQGVWGMLSTLFSKEYETKVAVNDVSFTIHDGEIVGYIGSNGAGKSTLIKLMNDLLTPTSGEILINGEKPGVHSKEIVAYLPESDIRDGKDRWRGAI